jgi:isopenicillin-N N-acyltransferase like protein
MNNLPILDLPEDPYQRGLCHGQAMAASVAANVETYFRRFEVGGLPRARAEELASRWESVYERAAPDYFAEMAGIAAGARVPMAQVVMVNARYELTYGVISAEAMEGKGFLEPDGCTSFGLLPEATAHGHAMMGQNWDWLAAVQPNVFIARVRRRAKPSYVGFTEAGIVGCKMGLNEAGIGLAVNGMVSADDGINPYMRPLHVRCQDIMDSERFDQAIGAVLSERRTGSANIMLGHADGEIIDIEATPNHCSYIYPREGIVTHANHLEKERRTESLFERLAPHTLYRGPRLRRLLERRRGNLDLAGIVECLGDHFGRPNSICRHVDAALPPPKQVKTVCALVIDFADRAIHACAGSVCESPLVRFSLSADGPVRDVAQSSLSKVPRRRSGAQR